MLLLSYCVTDLWGLEPDNWDQFHLSANRGENSPSQFYGWCVVNAAISPALIGLLHRDYNYKSIAIRISHDYELVPIPHTGVKLLLDPGYNQRPTP